MISSALQLLNTHFVKENIKNTIGFIAFAGGIYTLATEKPEPKETLDKVLTVFTRISLVLACITSRPGVYLSERVIHRFCSSESLAKVFGKNTIFALNPWHPRHIATIVANVFASSGILKIAYNRLYHYPVHRSEELASFNFLTGRVVLHVANAACRLVF